MSIPAQSEVFEYFLRSAFESVFGSFRVFNGVLVANPLPLRSQVQNMHRVGANYTALIEEHTDLGLEVAKLRQDLA